MNNKIIITVIGAHFFLLITAIAAAGTHALMRGHSDPPDMNALASWPLGD